MKFRVEGGWSCCGKNRYLVSLQRPNCCYIMWSYEGTSYLAGLPEFIGSVLKQLVQQRECDGASIDEVMSATYAAIGAWQDELMSVVVGEARAPDVSHVTAPAVIEGRPRPATNGASISADSAF